MLIKGTSKIKGVVEIPSIRQQLKVNQVLPISDKDYWNSDLQVALRMGYITVSGGPEQSSTESTDSTRMITCQNTHIRAISLPGFASDINPGAQFSIKESQLNEPSIRGALAKGMIKVVQLVSDTKVSEGVVRISKPKSSHPPTDVNDELPSPSAVIDDPNPPPVRKADIPDPAGRSIIFNPTSNKPINIVKGAVVATGDKTAPFVKTGSDKTKSGKLADALRTSDSTPAPESSEPETDEPKSRIPVHFSDSSEPMPVDSNENDPKKNTVIANPFGDPVTNTMKEAVVWTGPKGSKTKTKKVKDAKTEELGFVDQEQEKERHAKHPKLGDKPIQEKVLDAIDLEEANRKPHPVLDKKRAKTDVDFVEINPPKPHPKLDQKESGDQDGATI